MIILSVSYIYIFRSRVLILLFVFSFNNLNLRDIFLVSSNFLLYIYKYFFFSKALLSKKNLKSHDFSSNSLYLWRQHKPFLVAIHFRGHLRITPQIGKSICLLRDVFFCLFKHMHREYENKEKRKGRDTQRIWKGETLWK